MSAMHSLESIVQVKELGNTGLRIPELTIGTWQYQGGIVPLRVAIELGACLIDTAESYGTEEIVGEAIKGIRHQVFVATKVSPRHFKRAEVVKAAEQSLKRLKTDYIDLYQLHWPNYSVPIAETMAGMEELVEKGKIRFIGVSNFSARELEQARVTLSKYRIVSNQVRYSLVDRTIEKALLQYCEIQQITILAFSPLAHGLHNIKPYDPKDVLGTLASAIGKTRAQVALNWCISHKPVVPIFTASQVSHVQENCGGSGWYLSPVELELLERKVRFKRRGRIESFARRVARRTLQGMGRNM